MKSVSVIVPYLPDGGTRTRNWEWLKQRWEHFFPEWEMVVGAPPGDFRRGKTIKYLAERASGDVWVVTDADVWIHDIRAAVELAPRHPWIVPFDMVWRLDEWATKRVLAGSPRGKLAPPKSLMRPEYHAWPAGGCLVIEAKKWRGIDDGFATWGGEDTGLAIALDFLVGPFYMMKGILYHLRHKGPARSRHPLYPKNLERLDLYEQGVGRADVLQALLDGKPTEEVKAMLS